MSTNPEAQSILDFWFGTASKPQLDLWWGKSDAVDQQVTELFKETYDKAIRGELNHWQESPKELLAFVILLDQFSRHMFRGTPEAFAADPLALSWANEGLKRGYDQQLNVFEKTFLYLPFEHSEVLSDQEKSVALFLDLYENSDNKDAAKMGYDFALGHHKIIERFGRFPHRNEILSRETTAEEAEFLKGPDSSY